MTDRLFVQMIDRGIMSPPLNSDSQDSDADNSSENASPSVQSPRVKWALYREEQLLAGPKECNLDEVVGQLPETIRASSIPNPMLKVIAIVPSEEICLTEVVLPSTQAKHIARALPFMLEDNLTEDVEFVHFALGAKRKSKPTNVAIVNRELLENWIALLAQNRLRTEMLVPDVLLAPIDEKVWTVLFCDDRVLLRTGQKNGLAFQADQTATLLSATLEDAIAGNQFTDGDITIQFHYVEEDEKANLAVNLAENELIALQSSEDREFPVLVERQYISTSAFEVLCENLCTANAEKDSLNLLQGEYKQETIKMGSKFKWKPAAALFTAWMVLFLGGQLGQTYYYNQKADALDDQSIAHFRTLFPHVKKVRNVKKQMSSFIRQAGGADTNVGFVPLLGSTGQFVYNFNKKKKETVILKRVTYDAKQGGLRVDMLISDFTDLETLKNQIEQSGLTVTIDAATKDADKVKARLRIKG